VVNSHHSSQATVPFASSAALPMLQRNGQDFVAGGTGLFVTT